MKYAGMCPDHGLIVHDAPKAMLNIKTGPYCPYCGRLITVLKTTKKNHKEK